MIYNLPHPLNRPGQQEAFDWLMASDKKFNIICAPTGSGKSAWVAEASKRLRTLVLTEHKSLQDSNYKSQYGFDILYGKSNYRCQDKRGKLSWHTAYDCDIPGCNCPYQEQLEHCLGSPRVSLNYAKFLLSKKFINRLAPDILFLDEAHNLSKITIDHIGFSARWENQFVQWEKPVNEATELNYLEAMGYFRQIARAVKGSVPDKEKDLKQWRKWQRLYDKIHSFNEIISYSEPYDWFYEANEERLVIKPLTAKYHFKHLFNVADKIVLMSATIKPSIASRLGLDESEFAYYEMPNAWPAPSRIIYDLNAPKINYKSSEADKQRQAELIASVIKEDKNGVIHVSSKTQAYELQDRLRKFQDALKFSFLTFVPTNGIGTDKQLQEWYDIRSQGQGTGAYCISWCFHEGVDLGEDDINILAKVPYPSIGSNYDYAKMEYDKSWYNEQTAYSIEQVCGRIRRGKSEHYAPGAKMVYLADSGWTRLKPWLSDDFLSAIRNWRG